MSRPVTVVGEQQHGGLGGVVTDRGIQQRDLYLVEVEVGGDRLDNHQRLSFHPKAPAPRV